MARKATAGLAALSDLSTADLSRELAKRQRGLPALYSKLARAEAKVKRVLSAIQLLGGGVGSNVGVGPGSVVAASGRRRGRPPGSKNRGAAAPVEAGAEGTPVVAAAGRRRGRPPGSKNRAGGGAGSGRKRPKNDTNLVQALAAVLKGTTMGVTEVTAAVQAAGYKTSAANFRTIVNQALIKSELFKKVSRGQYTAK